ncbi:MAG: DUF1559 domain-containing protein [Planctomycetaceae bacterium]
MPTGTVLVTPDPAATGATACAYCDDILPTSTNAGVAGLDTKLWMQDTRDWSAVHGGSRGHANILMADGSVKVANDSNGDGFLNPGFAATGGTIEQTGYTDGTVELDPFFIYSGPSIEAVVGQQKQTFEAVAP